MGLALAFIKFNELFLKRLLLTVVWLKVNIIQGQYKHVF